MIELRISYLNQYGAARFLEYYAITDFIKAFETKLLDVDATMIQAIFFTRKINIKNFSSLQDLYNFCIQITT